MRIIAIVSIFLGLALRYYIKRRRFQRTSYTGVQLFSSYEMAWSTKLAERLGVWFGTLLLIFGLAYVVLV